MNTNTSAIARVADGSIVRLRIVEPNHERLGNELVYRIGETTDHLVDPIVLAHDCERGLLIIGHTVGDEFEFCLADATDSFNVRVVEIGQAAWL